MKNQWTCTNCDVTWLAEQDERIADVCWLCGTNNTSVVWTQLGRPVTIVAVHDEFIIEPSIGRMWEPETRSA